MPKKNDAMIICPNCGTEMVRARFEIEDGWIRAWLCECDGAEDAEMAKAVEEDIRYGTATLVPSVEDSAEAIHNFNRALQAIGPLYDPQASC